MLSRGNHDECDGVQLVLTAALGQTYAFMSMNHRLRNMSLLARSLAFVWIQECDLHSSSGSSQYSLPSPTSPHIERLEAWKKWTAREAQLRAVLWHYILDGLIAVFSGNPTSVRHEANPLLLPAPFGIFEAATADEWIDRMQPIVGQHRVTIRVFITALFRENHAIICTPTSELGIRALLESLQAIALQQAEAGAETIYTPPRHEICAAMLNLRRWQISQSSAMTCLLVRWHLVFISMAVDIRTLCENVGLPLDAQQILLWPHTRHAQQPCFDLHAWTASIEARCALLHALAVRETVQDVSIGQSHAMHLPFAVFAAATVQTAFLRAGIQSLPVPSVIDWDAVCIDTASATGAPNETIDCTKTREYLHNRATLQDPRMLPKKMSMELNLLHMQLKAMSGTWGIARQMVQILEQWRRLPRTAK